MPTRSKKAPRARPAAGPAAGRRAAHEGKVRKEFWLDPHLLADAQAALGAATERETVELALDLVAFRRELVDGTRALRGLDLARLD